VVGLAIGRWSRRSENPQSSVSHTTGVWPDSGSPWPFLSPITWSSLYKSEPPPVRPGPHLLSPLGWAYDVGESELHAHPSITRDVSQLFATRGGTDPRLDTTLDPITRNQRYTEWLLNRWHQREPGFVAEMQKYLGIVADGLVGPQTREAIRAWQSKNGLPPTGEINYVTMTSLILG
jgi:hypothetical protein